MASKLPWRQATTLILARDARINPNKLHDFITKQMEILYVKRSRKSSDVFSSNYAFPGGTADAADFSSKWWSVYEKITERLGVGCVRQYLDSTIQSDRNILLYKEGGKLVNGMPPQVAFRICAIRETFEETGLLLCINAGKVHKNEALRLAGRGAFHFTGARDLSKWRESVHTDAHNFIALCNEFNCVPDVWNLLEWSNWLTPPTLPKRWDTMFYLCCLKEGLAPSPDKVEISSVEWLQPKEAIERFTKCEIELPAPTLYESSRLNRFHCADMLERFALWRAEHHPCSRINPAIEAWSGETFISMYKNDAIYDELVEKGLTQGTGDINLSDIMTQSGLFHRYIRKGEKMFLLCNAVPMDGHLIPSLLSSRRISSKL